ncbi:MAG TPA: DUF2304 domain-containing protein [Solirubrobacteraceae bacterium]|jgi:hypothetical protein|nr:DUF2304 domain-containing protein [Solirubrobacteraceae bacterium]
MTHITLQRGLAILVTLGLLVVVFELVRRKRLSERYAILWLLAALTLFVLAVWKGLLTSLSQDVGISYPPSALFAVAIGLIAVILLHFSLAVSRLSDQNKILAQRLGLLQQRVEQSERADPSRASEPTGAAAQSSAALAEREPIAPAGSEHANGGRGEPLAAEQLSSSR